MRDIEKTLLEKFKTLCIKQERPMVNREHYVVTNKGVKITVSNNGARCFIQAGVAFPRHAISEDFFDAVVEAYEEQHNIKEDDGINDLIRFF